MIPPPLSVGLTLCHYVMVEERTRNVSLIGGFSRFRGREFPFTPSPFYVYTSLTGGHETGELELTVTSLQTDEEVFALRRPLTFPDRLTKVSVLFRLNDCEFPAEGFYLMTLSMDGEWVAQLRFEVSQGENSV
jgi:hypothetical protein